MAIYDFYRSTYNQVAITITSNEVLGILDTDYIEDYYGVDGQVTLFHPDTGVRYPVLMTAIVAETQFRGYFQLQGKPLGRYEVQGKVRDRVGNVTIMGALVTGQTSDPLELALFLREGEGPGSGEGILRLEGVDRNPLRFDGTHTFDYLQFEGNHHLPLVFKSRHIW